MGANAQTTVPDFVAETVLTAAKLDISAATGVPVFATTVTRDAAFGGANKVLAEGQTCYLEDANVVQYYDGAAWATVGPAAAGALTFIASVSLTGASTTSGVVFTSTYENYFIVGSNVVLSNAAEYLGFQLDASGVPAASEYYGTTSYQGSPNGAASTSDDGLNNVSNIELCQWRANTGGFIVNLLAPNVARTTLIRVDGVFGISSVGSRIGLFTYAYHATATAYNQIKFLPTAGTITSGTVRIYGYSNS